MLRGGSSPDSWKSRVHSKWYTSPGYFNYTLQWLQKSQTAAFDICRTGCELRGRVEDVDPSPAPSSRPTVAHKHKNGSRMTPGEKIHILLRRISIWKNKINKIPASTPIHLLNNLQLPSDSGTSNAICPPAAACYCTIKHGKHRP